MGKFISWVKKVFVLPKDDEFDMDGQNQASVREEEVPQATAEPNQGIPKKSATIDIQANSSLNVVIFKPAKLTDGQEIADFLKKGRTVILNFEKMQDDMDVRCLFSYLNGALYMVDGTLTKATDKIIILTPAGVPVETQPSFDYSNAIS